MEDNTELMTDVVPQPQVDENCVMTKEEYLKIGIHIGEPVTLKEKIFYGMGAFYDGGGASIAAVIMLAFFNKGLGLGAFAAGLIILLAKAWDAISDPLCGVISDNLRTKIGRRRPFFILGGALLYPAFAFVFAPIAGWSTALKLTSAIVAYLFYCTVSTISQVPFMSFASDISADHVERNKANTFKLLFSMVGAAISYLLPSIFLEMYLPNEVTGEPGKLSGWAFWAIMTFGFGTFFGVPLILSGVFCKEKAPFDPNKKAKFTLKNYGKTLKVKSFRYHLGMYISAFMCLDIISALVVYYATVCMAGSYIEVFGTRIEMSSAFIIGPLMVMVAVTYPIVYKMMMKKSKQFAFRTFLPLYIIGGIALLLMDSSVSPWWVIAVSAIMGIGFCGAQTMPWIIFPDTVDVAELKYHERNAGEFSGVMTFARKLVSAVAVFLCGLVLNLTKDFAPGENIGQALFDDSIGTPGETYKLAVRIMMGGSVVILISFAMICAFLYKVTDKKLERVHYFNNLYREGKIDTLSEEEKKEYEDLIEELAGTDKPKKSKKLSRTPALQEACDAAATTDEE